MLFCNPSGMRDERVALPTCFVSKESEDAVTPGKMRASDIGFDLTIIKETTRFNSNTVLYDTGIRIQPETGWYTEVVPRSSLSKSGYVFANSIGIIDPPYTGSIKVALTKVNPEKPDIVLPCKVAQLVFHRANHVKMIEVPFESFIKTERSSGGFGSTDEVRPTKNQKISHIESNEEKTTNR